VQFLSDWGFTPELIEQGCVIATAWGSDIVPPPGEGLPSSGLLEARLMMLRHSAAVTTCGPRFANVVAEFANLDRERIDVLPFGVDLNAFDPEGIESANGHASSVGTPGVVGFYKGFRAVYGPTILMHAIPIVLERAPRTRFELVGDGAQLDECRAMAQAFGVCDSVTWLPRRSQDEIPGLLARWDVSVIPSVHEAFGVAALESSAMRVPVVASDVCGLRDTVVDGQTGRLVPPGDSKAFADAIVDLLNDQAKRHRMGEAGRAFVSERFEAADMHDRWLRYFERVRERQCVMI